jgi:DNA-binding MltR family transcriptional regulator
MKEEHQLSPADSLIMTWFEAMGESTRGFVICCVAMLDDELRRLIQSKMPTDEDRRKAADDIFDPLKSGSLQSIHAKTQLAYAMGWIDDDTRNDVQQLARIRNIFAHERESPAFDDPRIQKLVMKLRMIRYVYEEADLKDLTRTDQFMMIGHVESEVSFDTKGKPFAHTLFLSSVHFILSSLEGGRNGS